ncbi:MAG TPA: carboxypeptidase-like regulatory domain-containing protein, partial [Blastocatellia bacterium]|nr:carboxypeptidase-like regulatory domain-containing protein [Blastocatellia bacterium]
MQDLKQPAGRGLRFACVVLTLLLWAASAFAQTGLGTVTGTVRDANNAVIRGANVTLTQTATNITRKAVTNEDGIYILTSVPIGAHTLAIEASGFKKWEGTLTVMVGQQSVLDAAMVVGSQQETVTVTDTAP